MISLSKMRKLFYSANRKAVSASLYLRMNYHAWPRLRLRQAIGLLPHKNPRDKKLIFFRGTIKPGLVLFALIKHAY